MQHRAFIQFAWPLGVAASLLLHFTLLGALANQTRRLGAEKRPVKVRIVEKKNDKPAEPPPPPPPPPPEPSKPKPKPQKQVASEKPAPEPAASPPPRPVQGISEDAMDAKGKVAQPLGNTQMVEDSGERLKTPPPPIDADLSADAKLISDSLTAPPYTDAALDGGLEGSFVVDCFVGEDGRVTEVELRKKIGYGMDERVINSLKVARFTPRKNKLGRPEAAWAQVTFQLRLP